MRLSVSGNSCPHHNVDMSYDFYSNLSGDQRERYDSMLDTNYVLLRCDEWAFQEEDEESNPSRSLSWIQSLQPTLELFGLRAKSYPQGSTSANRHYYQALRNYLGGAFPTTPEYTFLRQGLQNLLRLRRDDSSPNRSYLFGSFYRTIETVGGRERKKYRSVEVSLRHSATALWILCEESNGVLTQALQESLVMFMARMTAYLSKNDDWKKDGYRHLTLSSAINTFDATVRSFHGSQLTQRAEGLKADCWIALFSDSCMERSSDGGYRWHLPAVTESRMATYQFYLDAFVLSQVPQLLESAKAQSVVREMLTNKVGSDFGYGIPLHRIIDFPNLDDAAPDFGATVSCLFLLWYCLSEEIGSVEWLEYCEANFGWVLDFCLNAYDQKQFYRLPHSENNTKALLLPRYSFGEEKTRRLDCLIYDLKVAINLQMEGNGNLHKLFRRMSLPGFEHVKDIIETWQIPKYWKDQKAWKFNGWSEIGQFVGGIGVGSLKALDWVP